MNRDEFYDSLAHSAKGTSWEKKDHAYTSKTKKNGEWRYTYGSIKSGKSETSGNIISPPPSQRSDKELIDDIGFDGKFRRDYEERVAKGNKKLQEVSRVDGYGSPLARSYKDSNRVNQEWTRIAKSARNTNAKELVSRRPLVDAGKEYFTKKYLEK